MSAWRDYPEIDPVIIQALVNAVGADVFASMRAQFVADLTALADDYAKAHAVGDFETAREHAHALKGAAANIGLAQLSAMAGQFERDASDPGDELAIVLDRSIARLEVAP